MVDKGNRFSREEAAELRKQYLDGPFMMYMRAFFESHPDVKTVGLSVAQYYNDEASDAVHINKYPCVYDEIDLDAYHKWYSETDGGYNVSPDNLNPLMPGGEEAWDVFWKWEREEFNKNNELGVHAYGLWDDNYDAISLFGAFVEHPGSQDCDQAENYNLFCVYRRTSDGDIVWEYVCDLHRPYVDGCWPEWASEEELREGREGPMINMIKRHAALNSVLNEATAHTTDQAGPGTPAQP